MTSIFLLAALAVSAAPPLQSEVAAVAALSGEPAVVSAGGITRNDTPILTIETARPSPFDASPLRRLVIVGGIDGDERSAGMVVDAIRWLKTAAPGSIRREWIVSALPFADPDRHETPMAFPPAKGFFDDPERPETRYVWRWITYQAPDLVVQFASTGSAGTTTLQAALSADDAADLGPVAYAHADSLDAFRALVAKATGHTPVSRMHDAIAKRTARDPLAIARVLAQRYPETPAISYIAAVAWVNTLRLAAATRDDSLRAQVRDQTRAWTAGEKPLFPDRVQLTAVAGSMIFAELAKSGDAASAPLAERGAAEAAKQKDDGVAQWGQGWTDDMFMAAAVLARSGARPGHERDLDTIVGMLTQYAARLQRLDGLFNHALNGPAAWGRGNGFAALGLIETLTVLPAAHPARPKILDIYRRHMAAVRAQQAPDGAWREVIDEPGAYREESATAMLMTAMARGVRLGWLDGSYRAVIDRAWKALAAHVTVAGAIIDICTSTGSGPTRRYYLDRAAISGGDDRGGAMALLAAMEMYDLTRPSSPRP
jgi:rhamnogalacturonyl hydrolase YesR